MEAALAASGSSRPRLSSYKKYLFFQEFKFLEHALLKTNICTS
jgi:hypothetical protein